MDYVSTINLVSALGNDQMTPLMMLEEVAERTQSQYQTIAFSVDDALSLTQNAHVGSTIKVWGLHDFSLQDIDKIRESEVRLEHWHYRNVPPSKLYIEDTLPETEEGYPNRPLSQIDTITIHHSVGWVAGWTLEDNAINIANYHVNTKGWPGIGYHYMIDPSGEIASVNHPETKSNHVAYQNHRAVGICYGGDFRYVAPTQAAIYAGQALVSELKNGLPNQLAIRPHKRMEDASTACPGDIDLDRWLKIVAQ